MTDLQSINQEIENNLSPIKEAQENISEFIQHVSEAQRAIDAFDRFHSLTTRKSALIDEMENPSASIIPQPEFSMSPATPQVDLSATVLDAFAQKVQRLLQSWNFPGSDRVYFDRETKDIIIDGQPRGSRGKGLRAITHAAITIGLMDFCKERNLPHPGFVVLDSPLLAYYKPETKEDKVFLAGSDLKDRFYEYLASNYKDSQIVVIENEHPPVHLSAQINLINFTKNPNEGRYGFFPNVE